MSKLPPLKRLVLEDFPSDIQQWMPKLIEPLNQFMAAVSGGLDRKLTLADNLVAQFKSINVTVPGPTWTAPSLLNGWANFGSGYAVAGYMLDGAGNVRLKGLVANSGTPATGSNIFVLPSGYRPLERHSRMVLAGNNTTGRVDVDASGNVIYQAGATGFLDLGVIAFQAESGVVNPFPLRIKSDIGKPKAVLCVQAVTSSGHGAQVGIPGWDWDGKGQVVIRSVPSLPQGEYASTFLLLGG